MTQNRSLQAVEGGGKILGSSGGKVVMVVAVVVFYFFTKFNQNWMEKTDVKKLCY